MATLQDAVNTALNNAMQNNYDFRSTPVVEVAADLRAYDARLEKEDIEQLCVAVRVWQRNQKVVRLAMSYQMGSASLTCDTCGGLVEVIGEDQCSNCRGHE